MQKKKMFLNGFVKVNTEIMKYVSNKVYAHKLAW